MLVVRDIFRLKFGQCQEAIALWKEAAMLLSPLQQIIPLTEIGHREILSVVG